MDKAVSSPRPPPSFQGQGVPRGTNGRELFFLRASKGWERLGSWELQTWMFHARCQRSQPPAAPRLDAALPVAAQCMRSSPVVCPLEPSLRSRRAAPPLLYWRRPYVVVAGCRQKTQAESPQRTDREKLEVQGEQKGAARSNVPLSQPLLFLFGGSRVPHWLHNPWPETQNGRTEADDAGSGDWRHVC